MVYFKRMFLIASCVFLSFSFTAWQNPHFYFQCNIHKTQDQAKKIPDVAHKQDKKKLITIKNDVLSLQINLLGGNIENANLLNFYTNTKKDTIVTLLNDKSKFMCKAVSGILSDTKEDSFSRINQPLYLTDDVLYELTPNQNTVQVRMKWTSPNHITYTKIFSLTRGSYKVDVEYIIQNDSHKSFSYSIFHELQKKYESVSKNGFLKNIFPINIFDNIAWSTDHEKYNKCAFSKISPKEGILATTRKGWIAIPQKHFLTAWIPESSDQKTIYSNQLNKSIASISFVSENTCLEPDSTDRIKSSMWIGPKIPNQLEHAAHNLELTIDYGQLRFIAYPLYKLLIMLHHVFHNWGVTIIFLTFLIKMIMYPFTKSQYMSVLRMNMLHAQVQKIKKKFRGDENKIKKEVFYLYQSKNINSLNNFFSVIIQTPIFFSLNKILTSAIELRGIPFGLWIDDLSKCDPHYILPICTGLSMFFIQLFEPKKHTTGTHKIFLYICPFLSIIFFSRLPLGSVLIYMVNNWLTFFQHCYIRWNFVN